MNFNSLHFLIFFPIAVGIYFATPYRYRWAWLLGTSYYFYMSWKAEYVLLIIISTLIDYFVGIQMGKAQKKSIRSRYLILSLISNLGILFGFKYFNFFNESLRYAFEEFSLTYSFPAFQVLLPVGISFYTFQTLSYTIDVYRGEKEPETHLGIFALYVAFFPQLVAGPIERSVRLLPQFHQKFDFDYQRVTDGMKLMLWGFFKKLVIADRLALLVNEVYNNPTDYTGWPLIIATYFFAFQIYCDFSGYSDIAIGAAKILGYDLMKNFNRPYHAKSIAEFWRRWHISLSTWFRDYLYISLGGSRVAKWRWQYNLVVVFLVSGLWHGASWTFVLWGGLHASYLLTSIWTEDLRANIRKATGIEQASHLHKGWQIFVTFHLVTFAWIFFRANSIGDAFYIVQNLFVDLSGSLSQMKNASEKLGELGITICIIFLCILESVHLVQSSHSIGSMIARQPIWVRWSLYYAVLFCILMFGIHNTNEQFIYFQF